MSLCPGRIELTPLQKSGIGHAETAVAVVRIDADSFISDPYRLPQYVPLVVPPRLQGILSVSENTKSLTETTLF
jgi:hypothetical protein